MIGIRSTKDTECKPKCNSFQLTLADSALGLHVLIESSVARTNKRNPTSPSFSTYKVGDNSVECGSLVVKGLSGLPLSLLASAAMTI